MVLDTSVSVLGKSVEWFSVLSLILVDFSVVIAFCDVVLATEVEILLKQVCVNVTPKTPPVPEILNSVQQTQYNLVVDSCF